MVAKGERLRRRGRPRLAPGEAWTEQALRWFSAYDVLLSPVIARPAPEVGWGLNASYLRAYLTGAWSVPYTQAWNVTGFPALSLPVPGTPQRPGAVQIVGPPGQEATILALATQLQ
jgi:amidase